VTATGRRVDRSISIDRDEVTVGRGPFGVRVGCLPLLVIAVLILGLLGCVCIALYEDGGWIAIVPGAVALAGLVLLLRYHWPSHRLVVSVRADALVIRQGRTHLEFERSAVGMVRLTLVRAGTSQVTVWSPDGATLGAWDPVWLGLQSLKLQRALRRFGYPYRRRTISARTGKYVDLP
jgi:hypothetical protein